MTISRKICGLAKAKFNFFIHNAATHVWREDEAAYSHKITIPTMKYGAGYIIVQAYLAYSETEELRILDSTMKSARYIKTLDDCLQSSVSH